MESFDPIGRWRDKYPQVNKKTKALKVDSSGEMPSGEKYAGFEELRKILVETRTEMFTRHLISTVLTHATGRHMEAVDQYEIQDIQDRVKKDGGGLRTLVIECLVSDIFRSR